MTSRTSQLSQDLLKVIEEERPKLADISDLEAQARHGAESGWSRKQEMGHLIDSATNNRVRFVFSGLVGRYSGPTYDGEGWVRLGGYATMPWDTIVGLWFSLNQALATLIGNIPDSQLQAGCQIGSGAAVTLEFLIEDYILHMQHHLDHVLGREVSTSYPGAAMGV